MIEFYVGVEVDLNSGVATRIENLVMDASSSNNDATGMCTWRAWILVVDMARWKGSAVKYISVFPGANSFLLQ